MAKKLRPFVRALRPLAIDARPDAARPLGAHPAPGQAQRPHRADQLLRPGARHRASARSSATARIARGRPARLDQGAGASRSPSWPTRGPTPPTSSAGSTTSATPASTTRSAAAAARRRTSTCRRTSTRSCPARSSSRTSILSRSLRQQRRDLAQPAQPLPRRDRARRRSGSPAPDYPVRRDPGAARRHDVKRVLGILVASSAAGALAVFCHGRGQGHRGRADTTGSSSTTPSA